MSATIDNATREVPARTLPVPDTVSPQMQAIIGRPMDPSFKDGCGFLRAGR